MESPLSSPNTLSAGLPNHENCKSIKNTRVMCLDWELFGTLGVEAVSTKASFAAIGKINVESY